MRILLLMRRILPLLPLLLLVGCSGAMQDFGKRLVVGRVADELDLDREQRHATRASVDRLVDRAPDLLGPRLEILFTDAAAAITDGFPEEDLISIGDRMEELADDTMAAVFEELAPLLATLRDAQIDHFAARAEERIDAAREKLTGTPAERLERRQEAFIDALEKWTGSLDDAQERALRDLVRDTPDDGAAELAAREAGTRRLLGVLRTHPGPAAIRDTLWEIWRTRNDWGPDSRAAAERSAEGRATLRVISELLRPEQRESMTEYLESLQDRARAFLGAPATPIP